MCSVEPMSRDWVCYLSRRTSANPTVSHLGRYCASALAQAASKNRQAGDIEFAVHACRLGARCRKSSQNPKSCPNVSPAACRSGKKKTGEAMPPVQDFLASDGGATVSARKQMWSREI